jgi:uroporphyrinogen-III decarboxylase
MTANAEIFSIDYQVDLKVAFEKVGRAQAILGNVRPPHALFAGTPQMVLDESLACIDKSKGYRFFLGAGCDIPPGSPEENVMMMSKAIKMRRGTV